MTAGQLSGFFERACLSGMHIVYIVITLLAAVANSYAAWLNFVGAESVKAVADRLHLSQTWMIPLGILLASGAAGLSIGLAVPALGKAAAIGLILYFICALSAHIRARDPEIGGAVTFLVLGVAALIANVAYHSH
jgi:hypothetical protein